MAENKKPAARLQDLPEISELQDGDRSVWERGGKAWQLTAKKLIQYLIKACDAMGILGVHIGPEPPESDTQNLWIQEVEDYEIPDEAYAAFDVRYPLKKDVPTKVSQLTNDSTYLNDSDAFDDNAVSTGKGWHSAKIAQNCANALTVTVKAPEVTIKDVSPNPHSIACKVSGISALSTVMVSRWSGNMFPDEIKPGIYNGVTVKQDKDGSIILSGTASEDVTIPLVAEGKSYPVPDGRMVFSVSGRASLLYGGNGVPVDSIRILDFKNVTLTGKNTIIRIKRGETYNSTLRPMANRGETLSAFSAFHQPGYYPVAPSGDAPGMTSLPGAMTVLVNNPSAMIELTYNQDPVVALAALSARVAELENRIVSEVAK